MGDDMQGRGPIRHFLVTDHERLDALLSSAVKPSGEIDLKTYAEFRAGLDPESVLRSVSSGAAGSWSLSNLAPRILAGDFAPGFFVEHFVKDMGIALAEAERMGLALPGLALARQLYVSLVGRGHGRSGTQALQLALAGLSGVEWPVRKR